MRRSRIRKDLKQSDAPPTWRTVQRAPFDRRRFLKQLASVGALAFAGESKSLIHSSSFGGVTNTLTPQQDWNARSTAPGVVSAFGMDNTTSWQYINPISYTTTYACFADTSICVLPGGSIRFDILQANSGGADVAGSWQPNITGNDSAGIAFGGVKFSENSTFWVQYRMMIDANMYANLDNGVWNAAGGTQWKIIDCYAAGGVPYDDVELAMIAGYLGDGGIAYTDAANIGCQTAPTSPLFAASSTGTYLLQQDWLDPNQTNNTQDPNGYGNIAYGGVSTRFQTSEWLTVKIKMHVGTWGDDNPGTGSTVEIWTQRQNSTVLNKRICCRIQAHYNNGPTDGWGTAIFTPYMTGLTTWTGPTARMWISEFIVSSQDIAATQAYIPPVVAP